MIRIENPILMKRSFYKSINQTSFLLCFCLLFSIESTISQSVGIGTVNPNSSAILDLTSSSKGFLPPRMSTVQRNAIQKPADGLQIMNTTTGCLEMYYYGIWNKVFCPPLPAESTINDGLVAFYPFSGNAGDSSGNGNHGVVNGPILTTDRFNQPASAYSFSGNNITVAHNPVLNLSGGFTISLWYLPTSQGNAQDLIMKGNDNQVGAWWVRHHSSTFYDPNVNFAYRPNSSGITQIGAPTPELNKWHHFLGVVQGATFKVYLNGAFAKSISNIDLINAGSNTYSLIIGTLQYPFTGKIDEVRIYNRTLSEAEVLYLASH